MYSTTPPPPPPQGFIYLSYDGNWALFDSKLRISVNGSEIGVYSFKKPFQIQIPVTRPEMHLHVLFGGIRTDDLIVRTTPGMNYYVLLDYNRAWGSVSFILRR